MIEINKRAGDDPVDISSPTDVITIFRHTKTTTTNNVYLTEEISNQKYYTELFNLLRNSKKEEDIFVFYINNFGGMSHTGIELINSMKHCEAPILARVTAPIYSMAPLIALSADQVYMEPHSMMMFHDYSGIEAGKGNEMESSIKAHQENYRNCFKDYCKGFLTNKEMDNILKGRDLYLNKDECNRRLTKIGKNVK